MMSEHVTIGETDRRHDPIPDPAFDAGGDGYVATPDPVLRVSGLSHRFGERLALNDVSLELHPAEVVAVVGESGSGKSTLLNVLAGALPIQAGRVDYLARDGALLDLTTLPETSRRALNRTEWGFVRQNPDDGLRMSVSAGANVCERLMDLGWRHFGRLNEAALDWMRRVELDTARLNDPPRQFSGGMKQRLQIARNLVSSPRLLLMDEPTSGLDVSVQARLLDLLRVLVSRLGVSVIVVTHDLGVARLLAHRTIVMRAGRIVEAGLTDRVLDDPEHPYTQLLVSSVLQG
ncbi:MAG: phosphonate C-P lyase system protein PhnK [Burkholderiaceae bacterium]